MSDNLDALREALLNLETIEADVERTKRRISEWIERLNPAPEDGPRRSIPVDER